MKRPHISLKNMLHMLQTVHKKGPRYSVLGGYLCTASQKEEIDFFFLLLHGSQLFLNKGTWLRLNPALRLFGTPVFCDSAVTRNDQQLWYTSHECISLC